MTTKYKIILGFLLMMVLLGTVSFLGYNGVQRSSEGFTEYRRLARLNVATSNLDSAVYAAAFHISQFLDSRDPADAEKSRRALASAKTKVKEALDFVVNPKRRAALQTIGDDLEAFRNHVDNVEKALLETHNIYKTTTRPQVRAMAQRLLDLSEMAKSINNIDAMATLSSIWFHLSAARSSISRFLESHLPADAEQARERLANTAKAVKILEADLRTDTGRKTFAAAADTFAALNASFAAMDKSIKLSSEALDGVAAISHKLDKDTGALGAEVNEEMLAHGQAMLRGNEETQRNTLSVGMAGMLLAILCAASIIISIIRVLKQVGGFAEAVVRGNFSYQLTVREKGEIGAMMEAMKHIPRVLEQVMRDVEKLAGNVLSGRFRERLDAESLPGSFGQLANAVNSLGNAYTGVMDALPVPLMACDKTNSILFLNRAAQGALGGELTGTKCSGHLKAAECGTDKCLGACAMARNGAYAAETAIHPQDKRMDVSVTAMPLHNLQNDVVGYLEVITDLSAIKAQQTTMLRVAHEASEISDRVAAASEQLAAQVEQISRGAEMQRARVESTATAMEEMNSTVLEVARNAGQASERSEGTRQKAEAGANLVNQVVQSINTVNKVAVTLQENMQELGKQAESIGGVMNVISDIADQTNLLALNAAIEAARAGEAGRGFAVVADEVRKLAEKTMSATHEVGASISAIQQSTRVNIGEVGGAVKNINDATGLANASGEALKEIVDLASANSSVVSSIATAAEEQSATSEEINRAVDEINRVVAETTEGMVQSSAAVQDLSKVAQQLKRVMEQLRC